MSTNPRNESGPDSRLAAAADPAGDLLERARAGDRDAHAALYELHAAGVMTVARRMLGSRSRAEDVLQDTFVEVIRGIGRFRSESEVATWIHRIAINKCLSQLRSRWWVGRVDSEPDPADRPCAAAIDAEIELERLLDRLPDVARAIVWLHDAEGFTHSEIAALTGRSESFSKSQLQRAYRRLRQELSGAADEEIESICTRQMKPV